MRVGIVCNPYHRGGITRWLAELAGAWRRQDGAAWFVTPRPRAPFVNGFNRPTMLDLLDGFDAAERPTVLAPRVGDEFEFGTEAYRASVYAAAVTASIPPGTPLIVSDDPAAWRAGALLADRFPLVGGLHGDHVVCDRLVQRFGASASALVCVSERVRRRIVAVARGIAAPVVVIPPGIRLRPVPERAAAGETLRLVFVGRLDEEEKRVSDLARIADGVRAAGREFTLDIIGDGDEMPRVRAALAARALEPHVRLHGWLSEPEVLRRLAESDVLLLPSNSEGMSVTVMEALSMGCGVVASRVSGNEDYERHPLARDCFFVHGVGAVDEAVRRIEEAARVPADRRARAARLLAESEFSIDSCARRYRELLETLRPGRAMPGASSPRRRLTSLVSLPVAAQRVARLWLAGRYHRPTASPAARR